MRAAVERRIGSGTGMRSSVAMLIAPVLLVLGMLAPEVAQAEFEQLPTHFGAGGEAQQIQGATGMAVNVNGTGGVQAGSLYVVGLNNRVVRFAPGAEGEEPRFEEAWGWGIAEGGPSEAYVRCGPAYHLAANPANGTYEHCKPANPNAPFGGEQPGHFEALGGAAVDQATGNVYVRNHNEPAATAHRKHHLIEVFTASGVPVGEGFGDAGNPASVPPESIAEGPEKLHFMDLEESSIAVDNAGTVYLSDADYSGVAAPEARVMHFEPCSAGNYESYCYSAGQDIFTLEAPRISLVGNSRLVVANSEAIREYPLQAGHVTAICALVVPGQLFAMTTNQLTGEVFYYTFADRSIHRRAACNESTGEFAEIQKIKPQPVTQKIRALALNQTSAWGSSRPVGILYAADIANGLGDIFAPAEVFPPTVEAESTANTTAGSTTLQAKINPRGFAVSFHFEYLTESEYVANGNSFEGTKAPTRVPASDGQLASGTPSTVTASVSDLVSGTVYRFRVVASSECAGASRPPCITKGGAERFGTYPLPAVGLPDGRAYELVSPAEKHSGEVFPAAPSVGSCEGECKPPGIKAQVFPMQSAPDGNTVAYMGYPFSPTEGAAVWNSFVSRRSATGWQTTAASPSLLSRLSGEHLTYGSSLTSGLIRQTNPQLAPQAPAGYENLYLEDVAAPTSLVPLLDTPPPHRDAGPFLIEYGGASPDFSAQFFAANDSLTSATAYAPEPSDPGATGRDLYEWRGGHLALVNVLPGNSAVASGAGFASASPDAHAVSENGRRVFWHVGSTLYAREDGQITRQLNHSGTFLTASSDGLQVLFTDGCLYSLLTETCTDLTQGEGAGTFQGIVGQSMDLARIYFVDTAKLPASGANERHEEAQVGKPNLYLYEAGAGTRFIATLLPADNSGNNPGALNDWTNNSYERTAEASPDGRYLAFGSTGQLTGYDNVGPCGVELGHIIDIPCNEAFLYDSATGRLDCASCNPTGEAPLGRTTLRRIEGERAWQPQPRYLTNSGRLFFDSQDRLTPRDTNGRVEDVYEAEPNGVGSCGRVAGCISLISPGSGSVDANFLAMDESGANAFFTTRERLVPADSDELVDLYDAREGGGFSAESELQLGQCQGEACQPAPNQPAVSSPSSQTFNGPGNVEEKKAQKCPKGKVRKSGKCVKKKKKRHAKRSHKRTANRKTRGAK